MKTENETVPGSALDEETPRSKEELPTDEVSEESTESDEGEMDPEQIEIYKQLGIVVDGEEEEEEEGEEASGKQVAEDQADDDDDDDSQYSKRVQKRISKMAKKVGESQRRAESAEAEIAKLKAQIANGATVTAQEQYQAANQEEVRPAQQVQDQQKPNVVIDKLKADIKALRTQKVQAKEEFDYTKEVELDEQIDDLKEQIRDEHIKVSQEKYSVEAQQKAHMSTMKIASDEFAVKNPYFKKFGDDGKTANPHYDEIKSDYALGVGTLIAKDFAGTATEYFNEIELRVNKVFPVKKPAVKVPAMFGGTKVRDQVLEKKDRNLAPDVSRLAEGLFGDDKDKINRVLDSAQ